jgi:hypothetical protein
MGEWFDQHPRAGGVERSTHVVPHADRVTHVVQRVEEREQIVAATGIVRGARDLEGDAIIQTLPLRGLARPLDRLTVVVETHELGGWERLGHEPRRGPVTAADVGDAAALLELGLHAVEGGDPGRHEVDGVPKAEEAFGAVEEGRVVLMLAHALSRPEDLGDPGLRLHGGLGQQERAREVSIE